MLAAGVGAALRVGVGVGACAVVGQGTIGGLGRARIAARCRYDGHLLPMAGVAADGCIDDRFRRLERAVEQSQIDLGYCALLKLVL